MRYTLKSYGEPFKRIMNGKKWVGRVVAHAKGGFVGIINGSLVVDSFHAPTEIEAFEGVVAKRLGFDSADALKNANKRTRANNRALKAHAQHTAREMLRGNFKPFDDFLKKVETRE